MAGLADGLVADGGPYTHTSTWNSPAFQVTILGSGGGPSEDNVTGLLVRSLATNWSKGSILAVDGGTHLAAIIKIFEEHLPNAKPGKPVDQKTGYVAPTADSQGMRPPTPSGGDSTKPPLVMTTGPFAGLVLPSESVKANAASVLRNLVSTYLITHPHLDHLSGFTINTASFQHTALPKKVAALPSTIDAIKKHIFNDVIWPNLSDEEGGVGLVSYMRLLEGGNVAIGNGEGRGYIEVVDGLAVKCWSVSHGHCTKPHRHRGSTLPDPLSSTAKRPSRTPAVPEYRSRHDSQNSNDTDDGCVYDSTAFFIRDNETGKEVLIFGDVEPDSISLSPRTERVWSDAAPKITAGLLKGIFIECSYDDSQPDEILFGHLAPRHLIAELKVLAAKVRSARQRLLSDAQMRKRKRPLNSSRSLDEESIHRERPSLGGARSSSSRKYHASSPTSGSVYAADDFNHPATPVASSSFDSRMLLPPPSPLDQTALDTSSTPMNSSKRATVENVYSKPLQGLKVVIIHMKDTLKDGPPVSETILAALQRYEAEVQLGCTFSVGVGGTSVFL